MKLQPLQGCWYGMLFARDGFVQSGTIAIEPVVDPNAYPTNVRYIMAQRDVRMRSGPGTQFSIIGFIADGRTARVTGISTDRNWWRVICTDDTVGSCWVTADPSYTLPTYLP